MPVADFCLLSFVCCLLLTLHLAVLRNYPYWVHLHHDEHPFRSAVRLDRDLVAHRFLLVLAARFLARFRPVVRFDRHIVLVAGLECFLVLAAACSLAVVRSPVLVVRSPVLVVACCHLGLAVISHAARSGALHTIRSSVLWAGQNLRGVQGLPTQGCRRAKSQDRLPYATQLMGSPSAVGHRGAAAVCV